MIGQPARSGYQSTRFSAVAREYGLRPLLVTPGTMASLGPAGLIGLLAGTGILGAGALSALALGLVIASSALVVLLMAMIAHASSIFDRPYAEALDRVGTLRPALFAFWWTAALASASLISAIVLVVVAAAGAPAGLLAPVAALAGLLGMSALAETLALGGTIMRHSLYRALTAGEQDPQTGEALG